MTASGKVALCRRETDSCLRICLVAYLHFARNWQSHCFSMLCPTESVDHSDCRRMRNQQDPNYYSDANIVQVKERAFTWEFCVSSQACLLQALGHHLVDPLVCLIHPYLEKVSHYASGSNPQHKYLIPNTYNSHEPAVSDTNRPKVSQKNLTITTLI